MSLFLFKCVLVMCWISFFVSMVISWRSQRKEESILFRAIVAFMWGLVPVGACFILSFAVVVFIGAFQWTLEVLSL